MNDEDPKKPGIKGYLHMSIAIVGPGDRLKVTFTFAACLWIESFVGRCRRAILCLKALHKLHLAVDGGENSVLNQSHLVVPLDKTACVSFTLVFVGRCPREKAVLSLGVFDRLFGKT